MSTLRISNIEAKSVPASATIDEKVKITNSSGDPLVFIDGKTSGITTVGINTTDPNITFDANSNVVVTGIITATKFSGQFEPTSVGIADSIFHTGDTNTSIRFPSADTIAFTTGGSERLRISSNGLVNIGAGSSVSGLSPLLHLHKNASSSTAYLHITNNTTGITNNDGFLLGINGVGDCLVFNKDSTPIRFATQGIERLRITSNGQIGVGTDNPHSSYRFDIRHSADNILHLGQGAATLAGMANNSWNAISFQGTNCEFGLYKDGSGNFSYIMGTYQGSTAIPIIFRTGNREERLRIASDGVITAYEQLILSNTLPTIKLIDSANSQYAYLDGNSGNLVIHSDKGNTGSSSTLKLAVDNSVKVTVDSSGDLEINDGDLKVASGHGIDFSATSDGSGTTSSEILDEYEEGYYTPTATVGSGSITSTTSFSLRYVKIGGLVHLFGRLHFGTSAFNLTSFSLSLPFTNNTANRHDTSCVMHLIRGNGGDPVQGIRIFRVTPGGTTMTMQNHEGQANGNFGTNTPHLNVNFSYFSA